MPSATAGDDTTAMLIGSWAWCAELWRERTPRGIRFCDDFWRAAARGANTEWALDLLKARGRLRKS